jgi:hypothetical protein
MSQQRAARAVDRDQALWSPHAWIGAETLESLAEVNEQCLELLCEQAAAVGRRGTVALVSPAAAPAAPLLTELLTLWIELDSAARRRAARCPYLLLDAGFTAPLRWAPAAAHEVRDQACAEPVAAFFTVPRTIAVMRLVTTYAWHLANSQSAAARVLLGMSASCAHHIGTATLGHVSRLAEGHAQWLQPRWAERVTVWRDLLLTATSGEQAALERSRIRGIQLLAADARASRIM